MVGGGGGVVLINFKDLLGYKNRAESITSIQISKNFVIDFSKKVVYLYPVSTFLRCIFTID